MLNSILDTTFYDERVLCDLINKIESYKAVDELTRLGQEMGDYDE